MSLSNRQNKKKPRTESGYTIIELVVAVGLFTVIVLISSSAFLGVMSSNRKTLAMRTTMDNLNAAIETMSRDMKTGFLYHCGTAGAINVAQDCPSGDTYLAFEGQTGDITTTGDQIVYQLGPAPGSCLAGQMICKSTDGGVSFFPLTAPPPEISITGLAFRVYGALSDDSPSLPKQPRIVIILLGTTGVGTAQSTFDVETTISQRLPDFPP